MDTKLGLLVTGYIRRNNVEMANVLNEMIMAFTANTMILAIGDNFYGQLSLSKGCKATQLQDWTRLSELEDLHYHEIYRNWQSIIIVNSNNQLFVAGNNQYSRLGINEQRDILNFEQINESELNDTRQQKIVSKGIGNEYHTFIYCFDEYHVNSQLYAFGTNNAGSLGIGIDNNQEYHLKKISKFWNHNENIKDIQCTTDNSLFLTDIGNLYISGEYQGTLHLSPQQILPKENDNFNIIGIAVGHHHFLSLKSDKSLIIQRINRFSKFNRKSCQKMKQYFDSNKIKIEQIECGKNHGLVIDTNGVCYAFGCNDESQCGIINNDGYNILKIRNVIQASCGLSHNLILTSSNKLYSFGWNRNSQCSKLNKNEYIKELYCVSKTKELGFDSENVWIKAIIALPAESIIIVWDL